jgi:hypothetical protein
MSKSLLFMMVGCLREGARSALAASHPDTYQATTRELQQEEMTRYVAARIQKVSGSKPSDGDPR